MHAPPDLIVRGLALDSRKVEEGFLFFALPGEKEDGGEFIAEAKARGAACAVCEHPPETEIPYILVPDAHKALALCAAVWYGTPAGKLTVVGVTGTNGKTTTTYLIKQLLERTKGAKVGLIGTNQNLISDKTIPTDRTTPDALTVQRLLAQMVDAGCTYAVMEVSSHALMQSRVEGIRFHVGVFTNLTQDHLDVHGTMGNYYQAKKILFTISDNAIINIDDEYGRRYLKEISCPAKTYSCCTKADFRAEDILLSASGVKYVFTDGKIKHNVSFNMPGLFNVSNSLAVIACCETLGFDVDKTIRALGTMQGVRGRAEIVPTGRDFTVICDYAHTPDALVNVLSAIKNSASGKVKCLFGCGGNRDASKRSLMAAAAADNADFLIVTSDNPRNEDPQDIINDVLVGLEGKTTPYITIVDRREAIHWAIHHAEKDDIIVLAGKGHEDYQILAGGVKIHFDEREVVADALKELEAEGR